MSRVCAFNEWDPLEEVIVGSVEGARIPRADKGLHALEFSELASAAEMTVEQALRPADHVV